MPAAAVGIKDAGWQREHMSKNRLAILPDLTHCELFFSPASFAPFSRSWTGKGGSTSWADQVKGQ